jgi:hypothetical protein
MRKSSTEDNVRVVPEAAAEEIKDAETSEPVPMNETAVVVAAVVVVVVAPEVDEDENEGGDVRVNTPLVPKHEDEEDDDNGGARLERPVEQRTLLMATLPLPPTSALFADREYGTPFTAPELKRERKSEKKDAEEI